MCACVFENIIAFTGLIVAVSAWTILKPDPIFAGPGDPTGRPEEWTLGEMRKWLNLVITLPFIFLGEVMGVERVGYGCMLTGMIVYRED